MTAALPVHPFPARMAPQLALERLPDPRERKMRILDPMMGSGTIPVLAALHGHRAIGFDVDPLALLIARAWGRPLHRATVIEAAQRVVREARGEETAPEFLDRETADFVDYWFDRETQKRLTALAAAIKRQPPDLHDVLWCAFSRLIITKDAGASRARDVSHSRPHRVRAGASFDPIQRYSNAVEVVVRRHEAVGQRRPSVARLRLDAGDARRLPLRRHSVDAVLTSPPYLQAIDYMRGHRLSLVWMGYSMRFLRELRGTSIGTERGLADATGFEEIAEGVAPESLRPRARHILRRYVDDLGRVVADCARVLRPDGTATFVVAAATLEGAPIDVSGIVCQLMNHHGFGLESKFTRPLLTDRRYLPPPTASSGTLDKRMREEECLTFRRRRRQT